MTRRRSSIKGAASFRRLLKQLPDSANARLIAMLNTAGPRLADEMKARIPILHQARKGRVPGALRGAIGWKVTPTTLNLKVGLLNKKLNRSLFYGHILDVGRKAQVVNVTRRIRHGSNGQPYAMNVSRLQGLFLQSKGLADFRREILPDYKTLMNAILLDAARGAGDD